MYATHKTEAENSDILQESVNAVRWGLFGPPRGREPRERGNSRITTTYRVPHVGDHASAVDERAGRENGGKEATDDEGPDILRECAADLEQDKDGQGEDKDRTAAQLFVVAGQHPTCSRFYTSDVPSRRAAVETQKCQTTSRINFR